MLTGKHPWADTQPCIKHSFIQKLCILMKWVCQNCYKLLVSNSVVFPVAHPEYFFAHCGGATAGLINKNTIFQDFVDFMQGD